MVIPWEGPFDLPSMDPTLLVSGDTANKAAKLNGLLKGPRHSSRVTTQRGAQKAFQRVQRQTLRGS